jgi:hypothetical protein
VAPLRRGDQRCMFWGNFGCFGGTLGVLGGFEMGYSSVWDWGDLWAGGTRGFPTMLRGELFA